MMKLAIPLSIVALAVAACASQGPRNPTTPASAPAGPFGSQPVTVQQMPYYAGTGVVQSVHRAPTNASGGASAAPGPATSRTPTAPAASGGDMQRLGIKLDDGRMVWVDTMSRDFPVGTRVQLSDNFEIRKL